MHRISENKGWTHHYMLGERKRIIHRYFNYLKQDAEDEKKAMEDEQDKQKRDMEMAQMRRDREERLQSMGKM